MPTDHTDQHRSHPRRNHQDTKGWSLRLTGANASWRQNGRQITKRSGEARARRAQDAGPENRNKNSFLKRSPDPALSGRRMTARTSPHRGIERENRTSPLSRRRASGSLCVICGRIGRAGGSVNSVPLWFFLGFTRVFRGLLRGIVNGATARRSSARGTTEAVSAGHNLAPHHNCGVKVVDSHRLTV